MQIHNVSSPELAVSSAEARATTRATPAERGGRPGPVEGVFSSFSRALESVPEVRTESVARGRELYQEVPYPPTEIVNGISRLIARSWEDA